MTFSILLIRPQMGENIGAAARVMKNFGLADLRIVAPRDGWPNAAATAMATESARDIIEKARVFDTMRAAVADLHLVYGTTARDRAMDKTVFSPREFIKFLSDNLSLLNGSDQMDRRLSAALGSPDVKVGVAFGSERSGLDNEEVTLCDAVVSIDTHADCPSMNLAQAVAVMCYEFSSQLSDVSCQTGYEQEGRKPDPALSLFHRAGQEAVAGNNVKNLAEKKELHGLFDHLEAELDAGNFWKVAHKKPVMWRNIRNMLARGGLSEQDVRTWRGILRCLSEAK